MLTKRISDLIYDNIVSELNRELERRIQSSIRLSSRSMNAFPWINRMCRTLTWREFAERKYSVQLDDE